MNLPKWIQKLPEPRCPTVQVDQGVIRIRPSRHGLFPDNRVSAADGGSDPEVPENRFLLRTEATETFMAVDGGNALMANRDRSLRADVAILTKGAHHHLFPP